MKFIGGKQREIRDVWVRALLQPGEYYIFVSVPLSNFPQISTNWRHPNYNINFGLSGYGPEKINFTKVLSNPEEGINLLNMLKESLMQKALSEENDQWKQINPSGLFSQFYSHFEHSNTGYGFYAFRNETNRNIKVTFTLTKELNIKISKLSAKIVMISF